MKRIVSLLALIISICANAQNVGIGETAPGSKLAVKGSLSVGSSYSTTAAPTDGAIILGNVGIGTSSPSAPLQVNGKTITTNLQITSGAALGSLLVSDLSGNGIWTSAATVLAAFGHGTQNYLTKFNNVSGTTIGNSLVYDNGTNVGVNTASPGYQLDVNGVINTATGYKVAGATAASNTYLKGNGTNFASGTIAASDVPTLNQNTTGSAATFTGSLAGDVTGTQSATTLSKIQGSTLTVSSLASGNVLQYNGTAWVNVAPASLATNIYNTDGTLTGNRTMTMGADNLTLSSTTGNLIFNPSSTGGMSIGNSNPASNLLNVSEAAPGSGSGFGINLSAQTGGSNGNGGSVNIAAGAGGNTSSSSYGYGGSISMVAGAGSASGSYGTTGGSVTIAANGSALCSGCGLTGGSVNIYSGGPISGSTLATGNINFYTNYSSPTERMSISGATGSIGIGTYTMPKASIGAALFGADGADQSTAGPHVQYTTAADNYPVFQQLNWTHNNVSLNFDSYYDGSWKTGGSTSVNPMQIYKTGNKMSFNYATPASAGSVITWLAALTVSPSGVAIGSNGTAFNNMQAGSTAVPSLSGCSGGGCVQTMTISYSFPTGVTPNIICTVQSQSGTNYNDVYVTQVRSKSNTSATINVCRQDAYYNGEGWGQAATLSWIAWY